MGFNLPYELGGQIDLNIDSIGTKLVSVSDRY